MDEIAEIDAQVYKLRAQIHELNKRRINLKKQARRAAKQEAVPAEVLALPLSATNLSTRVRNSLKNGNVLTIGDLTQIKKSDFWRGWNRTFINLGEGSIMEIEALLLTFGLTLKDGE